MKKILTFILGIYLCLSVSAQIQRTFMGSKLGASKYTVLQNFKSKGYSLTFDGRFYEKTKLVSFGGMTWTNIAIEFTSNKFEEFNVFTTNASQDQYQQVLQAINKKYARYKDKDKWIPWYDDGITVVCITYVPNRRYLCLTYYDKHLAHLQISKDNSEF